MVTADQAQYLLGAEVVAADGKMIGTVNGVSVDNVTGCPSWVIVTTGWFGLGQSFIPLDRAQVSDGVVRVQVDSATIKNAPRRDSEEPLSPRDDVELHRYYTGTTVTPSTGLHPLASSGPTEHGETTGGESMIRWEEQSSAPRGSTREQRVRRLGDR